MFMFHSLQSLLQFRATPEVGRQIVFWMFGTLAKATWTNLGISALVVIGCVPFLMRNAWQLTALRLGEDRARSLGVSVIRLRLITITLVSLMTATVVSFVGTIGFIGLVAPHIARMLVGEDQRFLLQASAFAGALLLPEPVLRRAATALDRLRCWSSPTDASKRCPVASGSSSISPRR